MSRKHQPSMLAKLITAGQETNKNKNAVTYRKPKNISVYFPDRI